MPQLPGQTIGPAPESALPVWMQKAKEWLEQQGETWKEQPLIKVLGSPAGQLMAGAMGEPPGMRINLAEGRPMGPSFTLKQAFNGALDDFYGLPPGAGKPTRQPKMNAVNNIYNALVSTGRVAPQSELAERASQRAQFEAAKQEFLKRTSRGNNDHIYQPFQQEVAPVQFRAQAILDHVKKQTGYEASPEEAAQVEGIIRDLQRVGPAPTRSTRGRYDRGLGEVARQVAGQLQSATRNKSPLGSAIRKASGWADLEGGLTNQERAINRMALLQQMGK